MPSEAFSRWADTFNRRHRFGIPVLPIPPKGDEVPQIVSLPTRSGSLRFPENEVTETIELLGQLEPGQAVKLTEKSDDKENTARNRAQTMKEQILARKDSVPAGYKLRGHVLTDGEPTSQKIGTKTYKVYPINWAALSLVLDKSEGSADGGSDADSPAADAPAPENADTPTDDTGDTGSDDSEDKDSADAPATRRRR